MSNETRVLIDPAGAFRQLMREPGDGWWIAARRPLFLLFVIGCVVSFQTSGRLTACNESDPAERNRAPRITGSRSARAKAAKDRSAGGSYGIG